MARIGLTLLPLLAASPGVTACRKPNASEGTISDATPATTAAVRPRAVEERDGADRAPAPREAGSETRDDSDAGALLASERKARASYLGALAAGRKATRAGDFLGARVAFDRALVARPGDARALAERGYAALLGGELEAADADLTRALGGALEPKLAAAAYFNRGQLLERRGNTEEAQVAYAIANALESTPARRAKVRGNPTCTAELSEGGDVDVRLLTDWDELVAAITPILDRGSAKKSACIQSFSATGAPDTDDVCDGPPPWVLFHNRQWFFQDEWVVMPIGPSLLTVRVGRVGAWPARCANVPLAEASLDGGHLRLVSDFDGTQAGVDDSKTGSNPDRDSPDCVDVIGWRKRQWIDPKTARTLLTVRTYARTPVPTVTVTPKEIVISGAACDRRIARVP